VSVKLYVLDVFVFGNNLRLNLKPTKTRW